MDMASSVEESQLALYRADLPITKRLIYMNHAAVSPLSKSVMRAMNYVHRGFLERGVLCEDRIFPHIESVRAAVAQFIGAKAEEIAFTRNTTSAVLLAANAIRWKRGDNIVLPRFEFPANVYPWLALEKRGVKVHFVEPREGRVTAEMIAAACNSRTRAVTVSLVQFSNGYRIDAEAMGEFCRNRGIYFHVDAIQSLGAIRCNVRKAKIDFLSTGGHKWLMGPAGIGFFFCRHEILDELDLPNPGWLGVENAWDFANFHQSYRKDALRFEEGTRNLAGIAGLGAAIERFQKIGTERVEQRILELTDYLEKCLLDGGCTITSPRARKERSGILCFVHPRIESTRLFEHLSSNRISISLRQGALRISPHFYNTKAEADTVIGHIRNAKEPQRSTTILRTATPASHLRRRK